uniref:Uncharacterized protein n=1 Tax=Aegilops tauschii subsp. strangulata TaxID=200361 RepID=A0A453F0W3_AEGTS
MNRYSAFFYIFVNFPRFLNPWNMPAIQPWLQSIIVAKDFVHLMFSLMMFTSNVRFKIVLLPVLCWALDHVARFLRRNFARSSFYRRYMEEPCLWVETNNTTISLLCSNAEITLGFLMIVSLFSYVHSLLAELFKEDFESKLTAAPCLLSHAGGNAT